MQINLFYTTPPTEFEEATAHQIALDCNRDEPNDKDIELARVKVSEWNKVRVERGFKVWE